MSEQTGWAVAASADNAAVTAVKTVQPAKQHIVDGVTASFSSAKTQLLQVFDDAAVIWEGYVYSSREVTFPAGISIARGNACSAVLAASGTGGVLGKVNLHGRTR